jgi:hypothetical protein
VEYVYSPISVALESTRTVPMDSVYLTCRLGHAYIYSLSGGTPQPANIIPTIDDKYWFDLSKKYADETAGVRIKAAEKLQTTIGWFWTVYTTAIAITAIASKNLSPESIALLAAPSVVLILAYWMTVRAQMPASARFDPRSPDDIRNAFQAAEKSRRRALSLALAFSLLSAIALAIALYTLGTEKERPAETLPTVADFMAEQSVIERPFVRIAGTIPNAKTAHVVVTSLKPKAPNATVVLAPVTEKHVLICNVPVKEKMDEYTVSVSWVPSDGSTRSILKKF